MSLFLIHSFLYLEKQQLGGVVCTVFSRCLCHHCGVDQEEFHWQLDIWTVQCHQSGGHKEGKKYFLLFPVCIIIHCTKLVSFNTRRLEELRTHLPYNFTLFYQTILGGTQHGTTQIQHKIKSVLEPKFIFSANICCDWPRVLFSCWCEEGCELLSAGSLSYSWWTHVHILKGSEGRGKGGGVMVFTN